MNQDLRNASHEQIFAFVFDHDPEDEVHGKWHWRLDLDVQIDGSRAIRDLLSSARALDPSVPTYAAQVLQGDFR